MSCAPCATSPTARSSGRRRRLMAPAFAGFSALLFAGYAGTGTQNLPPPATPADIEILRTARTLRCDLDGMPSEIVIDAVNHGTVFGDARLVGNMGAADVMSVLGRQMVSFIEVTPSGGVNTITVYASRDNEQRFVAVYSRHVEILGTPTPSQRSGSCKVLE